VVLMPVALDNGFSKQQAKPARGLAAGDLAYLVTCNELT
jgi:hypothetical protein